MTELSVQELSVTAETGTLVESASFTLAPGQLVALLGPNGAGKTTLLRAALGLIPAQSGHARLDGVDTARMRPIVRARQVSYLPQTRPLAWPSIVRDVVALGRYAHGVTLGRLGERDSQAVDAALDACDLTAFAQRHTDTLSGGELARVHCARVFAAGAPLLVADEPVAALDPLHQHQVMGLIRLFVEAGGGALVVLHDISLAARFADRLIWMKAGRILADGSPRETLTPERLRTVYGVRARVEAHTDVVIEGPA